MSRQSALIANIIARITAIVPRTRQGLPGSFRHDDTTLMPVALFAEEGDCSRRFIVIVSGPRETGGHVGAHTEATERDTTFELYVAYEFQSSSTLAMAALLEDSDDVVKDLMRNDENRYDPSNTGLMRRVAVAGTVQYFDGGPFAIVPFEIRCRYLA